MCIIRDCSAKMGRSRSSPLRVGNTPEGSTRWPPEADPGSRPPTPLHTQQRDRPHLDLAHWRAAPCESSGQASHWRERCGHMHWHTHCFHTFCDTAHIFHVHQTAKTNAHANATGTTTSAMTTASSVVLHVVCARVVYLASIQVLCINKSCLSKMFDRRRTRRRGLSGMRRDTTDRGMRGCLRKSKQLECASPPIAGVPARGIVVTLRVQGCGAEPCNFFDMISAAMTEL